MLSREAGPWDIFIRIREKLGNSVVGKAMDCIACASVWLAAIVFFVPGIRFLVIILAVSAMSIIIGGINELLRAGAKAESFGTEKPIESIVSRPGTNI